MTIVSKVLSMSLSAPPALPMARGDCYIVGAAATGAWEGHENELALSQAGSEWGFVKPQLGEVIHDLATACLHQWNGSGWVRLVGRGGSVPIPDFTVSDPPLAAEVGAIADTLTSLVIALTASDNAPLGVQA